MALSAWTCPECQWQNMELRGKCRNCAKPRYPATCGYTEAKGGACGHVAVDSDGTGYRCLRHAELKCAHCLGRPAVRECPDCLSPLCDLCEHDPDEPDRKVHRSIPPDARLFGHYRAGDTDVVIEYYTGPLSTSGVSDVPATRYAAMLNVVVRVYPEIHRMLTERRVIPNDVLDRIGDVGLLVEPDDANGVFVTPLGIINSVLAQYPNGNGDRILLASAMYPKNGITRFIPVRARLVSK